jgi:tetratricopeptide (TPR) repeat protein
MRTRLALAAFLLASGILSAQDVDGSPARHVPKHGPSAVDAAHAEALRLYAAGLMQERRNRLLEAIRTYEKAARVAPKAAAIHRALVPLYLATGREDDALHAGRKIMALDPADFRTFHLLSRHLRSAGRREDAIRMLQAAGRSPALRERPDACAQVWFDLAVLQEAEGQLTAAEASLRKVTAILDEPAALIEASHVSAREVEAQAAETHEKLGQVLLRAKKVKEAEAEFAAARKRDPLRAPRLAYDLARVYQEQGKPKEALSQVEAYLASLPASTEAYELRIGLQRINGAEREVIPALRTSSERDPHNLGLKLMLVRELRKAGKKFEASQLLEAALPGSPTPEVYKALFAIYADRGLHGARKLLSLLDPAVAGALGQKAALPGVGDANDATNARTMLLILRSDKALLRCVLEAAAADKAKLHFATRSALATQGARANMLELAEALYRSCLTTTDLGEMEAETYAGLIQVLQIRHRNEGVLALAREGLKKAKHTPRVLFHRAAAYAHANLGRMKDALVAAEAAISAAEAQQTLSCRKLKAHVLSEMGDNDRAIQECRALVKEYNHGNEARDAKLALSRVLQAAGKNAEHDAIMEKLLEDDASDAEVCNDLGYVWADRGKKLDEAERLIRRAIELERKQREAGTFLDAEQGGDNAAYVDSLGWVLYKRGKLEEARRELERATRLPGGDDPVMWDHLGDVYAALKLDDKAGEAYKRAMALYIAGARSRNEPRFKELERKLRPR